MRFGALTLALLLVLPAAHKTAIAQGSPTDVAASHWAASAVRQVVQNRVMALAPGRRFAGDRFVTRNEAIAAIAKLARSIVSNQWRPSASRPVPQSVEKTLERANWQNRPVTRYALASALARFADYIVNGLPRPNPASTDLGKSTIFAPVSVAVPPNHPAHDALVYLAANHMVRKDSPLLNPDGKPLRAAELGLALSEMALGVNDLKTELGHDALGDTPDAASHKRRPVR